MPTIGSAAILSICAMIALYGPFSSESHLFYYKQNYVTMSVWIISWCCRAASTASASCTAASAHLIPELCKYFVTVSIGLVVVLTITFWTFIVYYQDCTSTRSARSPC